MNLPPSPASSFASDNTAGVAPQVLDALADANTPAALAYGSDRWTKALTERFRAVYDAPVEVLLCWGGTGANVVGLASMLAPWQAIICAESAHIAVDECGAPTRFTGAVMLTVPTADGKLRPADLDRFGPYLGNEHHPQPAVVSISQVSELGTVYSVDEITALADGVHRAGMTLHLDGARIANAVAATGAGLPEMIRDAGVDVMTFGATKNGAMYGEAVVYLRPELADGARFTRKQAGQLPSKTRFVAAQLLALLDDDLWLRHATHANLMARRLAAGARRIDGVTLAHEPEANAVFVVLPRRAIDALQEWSFFWDWDHETSMVRWMTSFATTADDVDQFLAGVEVVLAATRA